MNLLFQGFKTCILGFVLLGLGNLAQAQSIAEQEIPQKVRAAFEKKQPNATPTWRKGIKATLEACFERSGDNQVYVFGKNGGLLLKMLEVSPILLPSSINTQIASDYPFSNLTLAYKAMTSTKKKFYEVQIESPDLVQRLRFSSAGKQIGEPQLLKSKAPVPEEHIASSNPLPSISRGEEASPNPETASPSIEESTAAQPLELDSIQLEDLDLIDEDIQDLFEEDPLYNEEAGYDVFDEDDFDEENWEELWEEEEEDDAELLKELEEPADEEDNPKAL